ncbi:KAP family P-loop NTPase fold protein [Brumimicrobium mesophilum]|uniref:KAP family P-loop NTPase fold protein n=1 Tax=Brumimicrobium mesophilum TaxID=392717 RepID=UPI000D142FE5|nr:P-loop NTPase fold protein [Brumimicrobium mesophilum]
MTTLNPFEDLTNITFADCKLEREKYADVLTDIVRTNPNGFVLAIDNKWGTGKTTFVNMWRNKLKKDEEFKTLYFNAWENDFENNPFVAITAELKELLGKESSATFKAVLEKGSMIAKSALPSILKNLAKRYGGEDVSDILEKTSEGILASFDDDIQDYLERKKNIKDFHKKLEEYIDENSNGNPIVFIIDELDRCRPDYAVSVLENIKHLFSVKGIVFVLSIDKEQLGHAVCGVYGSEKMDSNEYLRRFIDVEYSLPTPELKNYVFYLMEAHKLNEFFNHNIRKGDVYTNEKSSFITFTMFIFRLKGLSLRQQDKIIRHAGITLKSFKGDSFIIPELLVYLIYLRSYYGAIYSQIKNKEFKHQQLIDSIQVTLNGVLDIVHDNYLRSNIEAFMVLFYNEYLEFDYKLKSLTNFDRRKEIDLRSKFDQNQFLHFLDKEKNNYDRSRTSIEYLLNKIDLMEPFQDM